MIARPSERSLGDWAALVILVACWGSTFAFTKVALETMAPMWIVAIRIVIGIAAVLAFLFARGERLPSGLGTWVWLAAIGIFSLTPFWLIAWGTQHIDTGVGGIILGVGPLFTIAVAHFAVPGERMTLPRLAGLLVGFVGLAVLMGPAALGRVGGGAGFELWAQLAILGAAIGYALQGVCAKLMPDISPFQKSAGAFLIAAILSVPLAALTETVPPAEASVRSLIATACMGLLSTGFAGIVMFRLITHAGPTFVSLTSYLIPLYVVALGIILFDEEIEANAALALVLIVSGIALSEWRQINRYSGEGGNPERGPH